jgi:UDP-N-acetyl-2-amino-2-deoxyglucuronate dehydrogenase
MKRFALIGAAGYIAPKHMKAIKQTGNVLVAALDKHDSVGILDNYFPEADFFTEFERFDRHLEKLKRNGAAVDYVVVCSPNYLHDAHIRFGLRLGADVICEKPVVLNPWNIDALMEMEEETGKKVFTVLQMRFHPAIVGLREKIMKAPSEKRFNVNLRYITPRGHWYHISWKGDIQKSGGIATNIGIHFFDILLWIFGDIKQNKVCRHDSTKASGHLVLDKAEIDWSLSIDARDLPPEIRAVGKQSFRSLIIDEEQVEFGDDFGELHTKVYEDILSGHGYRLSDIRKSVELVYHVKKIFT